MGSAAKWRSWKIAMIATKKKKNRELKDGTIEFMQSG